jgi:sigma-B regulation protein RsbU (phosphoserine phosphatase)
MIQFLADLNEANNFLNLLLDNINSAVLIADEDLHIFRFNKSFLNFFEESEQKIAGESLGRAMGCIHTLDDNKPCGETSYCESCLIRQSLIKTMLEKIPVDKKRLEKIFYIDGKPQKKILEISTRYISYNKRKMVLIIFYDVTDIERHRIELYKKQIQLDKDLEAAAGIQKSLLPDSSSDISNIKFAWQFEPCNKIGGDIFNSCYPDKDHMCFYMLDVCGHGVSAALISVAVSQCLKGRRYQSIDESGITSPKTVLNNLNQAFPFERFDSYFTIIYMVIDHVHGTLAYSCAGHQPPILIHGDRSLEVLDQHGPAIGLSHEQPHRQE